jgi:short subunit fatty acids transporter
VTRFYRLSLSLQEAFIFISVLPHKNPSSYVEALLPAFNPTASILINLTPTYYE